MGWTYQQSVSWRLQALSELPKSDCDIEVGNLWWRKDQREGVQNGIHSWTTTDGRDRRNLPHRIHMSWRNLNAKSQWKFPSKARDQWKQEALFLPFFSETHSFSQPLCFLKKSTGIQQRKTSRKGLSVGIHWWNDADVLLYVAAFRLHIPFSRGR